MLCISGSIPSRLNRLISRQFRGRSIRRLAGIDFNSHEEDKTWKREGSKEGFLHLSKGRGQHLLTNSRILDFIVRRSNIRPTDTVLEIGPGTGNLTLKLLETAGDVVAVEIDKRMVHVLSKRAAERGLGDRLTVIEKDALKTEFPRFDLVVANIPYGISSPLMAKLLFGETQFRSATLLLQKEFARRLMAEPGDPEFNRLAVNMKLVADIEFVTDVSRREFLPRPKVDSSVVIIRPKTEIPRLDLHEWWAFTRTCFSKKNKTLAAIFKQKKKVMELYRLSDLTEENAKVASDYSSHSDEEGRNLFKKKLIRVLESEGFVKRRPSKLSSEELLHLLFSFHQAGIYFHDQSQVRNGEDYVALVASYSS